MKALEVKDKLIEYMMEYLGLKGFKYKGRNSVEFEIFKRIDKNGYNVIGGGIANYNPKYRIDVLGFGIRHSKVADILEKVNEKIEFSPPFSSDRDTFNFWADKVYTGSKPEILNWYEYFTTEEGLKKEVDKIIEFLENGGMAAFDKYQDLREVDKIFNNLDNMWDPVHSKIGYSLGGYGYLTRIITAKLSRNPNYEKIVQWSFDRIEREYKAAKEYKDSWERSKLRTEILVEILKDIQPLYDSYE